MAMSDPEMSPEQMAQLQKENCVFCHIVSGKVASKKVYEDPQCIVVLDINPANPGHLLLIPKEHVVVMPQLSEECVRHLGMMTKSLSNSLIRALKVQGTSTFVANGSVAGQRAPHFMIHVIPRVDGDGVPLSLPEHSVPADVQQKIVDGLGRVLRGLLGVKEETDFVPLPPVSLAELASKKVESEPQSTEEPKNSIVKELPEAQEPETEPAPKVKKKGNLDDITALLLGR